MSVRATSITKLSLCCQLMIVLLAVSPQAIARAPQASSLPLKPVPMPLQDVGVIRMTGGNWHAVQGGMPASDVIYNNSEPSGFFGNYCGGLTVLDDGRVPSLSAPNFPLLRSGCATQYTVRGVQLAYCTDQPSLDVQLDFIDDQPLCPGSIGPPTATVALPGLPGSSTPGTTECFTVTIDLGVGPGSLAFQLMADGDGSYQPYPARNTFAWRLSILNLVGSNTGPLIAGNENSGTQGDGTRWVMEVDYAQAGSGLWNSTNLMLEGTSCYAPGCNSSLSPYTGLHLRLYADACGELVGDEICLGDGSGTACPCGNSSPSANREGCRSSLNGVNGARLEAIGVPSLSADSLRLNTLRLPDTTLLFFQGTQAVNNGFGAVFGDGLRCAGGAAVRLGTKSTVNGESFYPQAGDAPISVQGQVSQPGQRTYQVWYRNAATFCTPATFNLSNGWRIDWQS